MNAGWQSPPLVDHEPVVAKLVQGAFENIAALQVVQTLLGGAGIPDVASSLGVLVLFGVIGVPVGLMTLAAAIQYARREGTLGHV